MRSSSYDDLLTVDSSIMTKSPSIPIAPSRYHLLEQRGRQEERAALIQADYDDYVFYQRIVSGIAKTQGITKCEKLRTQNQALIDHLHHMRHSHESSSTKRCWSQLPSTFELPDFLLDGQTVSGSKSSNATPHPSLQTTATENHEDDEVLIFDIEI